MSGQRTEQPTPKKLRDSRRRGEVAKSRDLVSAAVLLAAAVALAGLSVSVGERVARLTTRAFALAREPSTSVALDFGVHAARELVAIVLPFALLMAGAAAITAYLQVGAVFSIVAAAPRFERINPLQGAKQLFSGRQWVELAKAVFKLVVIGWLGWALLVDALAGVASLVSGDAHDALRAISLLVSRLVLRVGLAMAVLGIADWLYQRSHFMKDQRMTKDEVRREHRDTEGDPHAKQARDRAYRELLAQATLAEVRKADVLVINPTHLAVALRYDQESEKEDAAPEVLAKGQDALAQRMIEAAREAGVPIMRDIPLARMLYELDEGQAIPEELYEAVAILLKAAWEERETDAADGRGTERDGER